VAAKKSAKYPYQWADGSWHSVPFDKHIDAVTAKESQRVVGQVPAGTYDPNLDAQLGVSQRGYQATLEDVGLGRERGATDLGLLRDSVALQKARSGQDYGLGQANIETGYQRNLSDLLKAREQGTADYGTNIADLQRGYQQLGTAQAEGQRKAGAFMGSGAAQQAARKRTANEAHDRAPIDTAYSRFMDASGTTQGRLVEDRQASLADLLRGYSRAGEDIDRGGASGILNYQRGQEDLTTTERRAGDEKTAFEQDVGRAKVAQFMDYTRGLGRLPTIVPPAGGATTSKPDTPTPQTLTANRKKRKGNVVTYYNTVGGP
jgi:hypothetical protein